MLIASIVNLLFEIYGWFLIVRIFLTWIPNIDWYQQPYKWISSVTDPFLNIFRGIIPPIGGMLDISPILAFILLQIIQGFVVGFLSGLGL